MQISWSKLDNLWFQTLLDERNANIQLLVNVLKRILRMIDETFIRHIFFERLEETEETSTDKEGRVTPARKIK